MMKVDDLLFEGIKFFKEGKYFHALDKFLNALKLDERNTIVIGNLAQTYLQLGEYNSALREFKKLLSLDPYDLEAHYEIVKIQFKQENYLQCYYHLLFIKKANEKFFTEKNLAKYLDYIKFVAEAIKSEKTLNIEPQPHFELAKTLNEHNYSMLAYQELKKGILLSKKILAEEIIVFYFSLAKKIIFTYFPNISLENLADYLEKTGEFPLDIENWIKEKSSFLQLGIEIFRNNKEKIENFPPEDIQNVLLILLLAKKIPLCFDISGQVEQLQNLKNKFQAILQKHH